MEHLSKKTTKVGRGYTYTYYTSAAKDGKATVLLCHGWPDTAEMWEALITNYLVPNGYGVVAIDCLGYGGTDKPTDDKMYNFQYMCKDVIDIMDNESIDKFVSMGHDWGCGLSQRMWPYHPDRTIGLVMLNVAYLAPTPEPFNLDKVIEMTTQFFGYGTYWYWKLFAGDDGPEILNNHIESLFTIAHGKPETWLETLCKEDGVRNFLLADKKQDVEPYATDEMRKKFIARMKKDKFDAPQCWYKAMVHNVQHEANQAIPSDLAVIKVPVLFFGGSRDMVCRPELMQPSIDAGLIPDCKMVVVDAGHWSMHAKPKECGEAVVGWLQDKF